MVNHPSQVAVPGPLPRGMLKSQEEKDVEVQGQAVLGCFPGPLHGTQLHDHPQCRAPQAAL